MVAHLTMRTNGVRQGFRFVEGMWLHRKSSQIRFFSRKRHISHHNIRAYSELSNHLIKIMVKGNSIYGYTKHFFQG